MSLKFVMSTEIAISHGVEETLKIASDLGFKAIELSPAFWGEHLEPTIPVSENVSSLKELLNTYDIQPYSACIWYLPRKGTWQEEARFFPNINYDLPRASAREYTSLIDGLIDSFSELGLEVINLFTYPYFGKNDNETLQNFASELQTVLENAGKKNISLCLEQDVLCRLMRSIEGLEKIIKEVNHPNFKLTFDPSNFFMVGLEPFPYSFEKLKENIHHIHLRSACIYKDGDPQEERFFPITGNNINTNDYCRFTDLKSGAVNIYGLIEKLVTDKYSGAITFQPLIHDYGKIPSIMKKDIAFVNRILDSIGC